VASQDKPNNILEQLNTIQGNVNLKIKQKTLLFYQFFHKMKTMILI
jgi:hypothetical protein